MREEGLLTLSEADWTEAKRRADIIAPLAAMAAVSRSKADEAANRLGLSRRQIYFLLRRYRSGNGLLTDLAPKRSSGGRGKGRLQVETERIIAGAIQSFYLSKQRYSEAALVREISKRCRQNGFHPPARNSIRKRIDLLDARTVARKRLGSNQARALNAVCGSTPAAMPLDVVQMDHTKVDLIVVDEQSREPIGRPFLTVAIDVFTRCIMGMLVSLESPSATSVGLCLANVVTDKRVWLERLGLIDVSWPMCGKPDTISTDNGPEFKSEALKRGCEQHGIKVKHRPQGQPNYGGIIERVIGTAMTRIHELPGTTFSNPAERGSYDAQQSATLTLRELEKWLVLSICTYHETLHGTLWETPMAAWKRCSSAEKIMTVSDEKAFLIDFLPVIRRKIGRSGFVVDHIVYYADILKPWIADRKRLGKFVIRRDPRDISRIWVLDPASNQYFEIPYRSISNPSVTLWEHQQAVRRLKERGQAQVDETAIFRMIDQMRQITQAAAHQRKRARRDNARRGHLENDSSAISGIPVPACIEQNAEVQVNRFNEIEQW